jgi:hypothetical protein
MNKALPAPRPVAKVIIGVMAAGALTVLFPATSSAQLSAMGGSTLAAPGGVRGTDSAYDPVNQVWLMVGAYGAVKGVFVSMPADPYAPPVIGTPFSLNDDPDLNLIFAHFARVVYSPHVFNGAGGFLVTWHQNDGVGGANVVHTRLVSYTTGLGPTSSLNFGDLGSWWEAGAPAAYSPTSQMFIVTWQACCSDVRYRMVDLNGQPVGNVVTVSAGYGREPGVAWNSAVNEFGISYDGTDLTSAIGAFARVSGTGVLLRRNAFHHSVGTFITDVAYNPVTSNYVMVFSSPWAGGTRGAEINANGDPIAEGVLSTTVGATDGLAVAYNPVSGTFLMTGHHASSLNAGGLELNKRGGPSGADRVVSSTNPGPSVGSFYPRPGSSTAAARWLVTYSRDYVAAYVQGVETTSTGGGADVPMGPTVTPGPTPSPGPSPTPTPTPPPGGWQGVDHSSRWVAEPASMAGIRRARAGTHADAHAHAHPDADAGRDRRRRSVPRAGRRLMLQRRLVSAVRGLTNPNADSDAHAHANTDAGRMRRR